MRAGFTELSTMHRSVLVAFVACIASFATAQNIGHIAGTRRG
jgi:hypothetical protein